jgi:hypothetical protein
MDSPRAPQERKISQLRSALLAATGILAGFIGTAFICVFMRAFSDGLGHELVGPSSIRIYLYEHMWFGLSVVFVVLLHWGFADWLRKAKQPKKVL